MKQTQLLMLQIRKSDGRNRLGNWYHFFIQVKFPNGTLAEYDLRVPHLKLSEVVQVVQNLSSNYSSSRPGCFKDLLDEDLRHLNATIFAARSPKS